MLMDFLPGLTVLFISNYTVKVSLNTAVDERFEKFCQMRYNGVYFFTLDGSPDFKTGVLEQVFKTLGIIPSYKVRKIRQWET